MGSDLVQLVIMRNISVIIPTYNRRHEVVVAIASILAQTAKVHEIIIVDDGSTDDTEEYIRRIDAPLRYIKTPNQGVSAARNHGILIAEGDWIAFLDSDDEWYPEKLTRQLACIENTGALVCFSGCENESGERLDDLDVMDPELALGESRAYPPAYPDFFIHARHPFIQSALVNKKVLLRAGLFDESLRVAEDTKLIYRLVMEHGYAVVNECLTMVSRERGICGLSDDNEPRAAMLRYECYTRVQAELYWPMLRRNAVVARMLRANHGYFTSRWAELAAVNGEHELARSLGREGLMAAGNLKSRVRSLLILISPSFFGRLMRSKWQA